ncbi:hypothetical protein [Paracidobacterium acidisoli]|uniref:Uncharacterized protein n=1 Tax=Paracidobacterium acidisoli TaxID=2303751 RepID=A0A372IN99_9BACT|nr:hypothetical protein [Paracidobacterium acidisoli]MBT9332106.1 hypothetical protein [Paracidobacterium acidisoli]
MNSSTPDSSSAPRLLPGMAIIALWMLLLSVLGLVGVTTHSLPRMALLICVAFGAAGTGLLRLQRWGWALALAAVFLSVCYGTYVLFRFRQGPMIVMILVNLIFFLYLVRPQVIERLR